MVSEFYIVPGVRLRFGPPLQRLAIYINDHGQYLVGREVVSTNHDWIMPKMFFFLLKFLRGSFHTRAESASIEMLGGDSNLDSACFHSQPLI